MRIILWGTYDTGKPRTRILTAGLIAQGMDLDEIHASLWQGIEDKSQLRGWAAKARLLVHWLLAYPALVWRLFRAPRADLILVGYPGVIDVLVASLVGKLRRIPVAWDVFISLYDTICLDRQLLAAQSVAGRLLFHLERFALRHADIPFLDTAAHARRIEQLFRLPTGHCEHVWVGVETGAFTPRPRAQHSDVSTTHVLFYGQFIPLHGIPTLVQAARLLQDKPIRWTLVGTGQESDRILEMLEDQPLPRLHWIKWVDYLELDKLIGQADLCLGIFGASGKASSVIPNKVFQIVAAGKPVITRDSPAIRELLRHAPPATYLVPPADAEALADAVMHHHQSRQTDTIAANQHPHLAAGINAGAIGSQFAAMIRKRLGHE